MPTAQPELVVKGLGKQKMEAVLERAKRLGMTPQRYLKHLVEEDLAVSERAAPTETASSEDLTPHRGSDGIVKAIEASQSILAVVDEDENPACNPKAWERATTFLSRQAGWAWKARSIEIDVPRIVPGPDGSVDLYWQYPHYEMLVNVPADPALPVRYYGDDKKGNTLKGSIASEDDRGLILWLTTRK